MNEEQINLLLTKLDALVDAFNANMGIPAELSQEELAALLEQKKQAALLNAEIQLLYAQKELAALRT